MAETLFTPTHVYKLADKLCAAYSALRGDLTDYGAGDGTYGISVKGSDIKEICEGSAESIFSDASLQVALNSTAVKLVDNANTNKVYAFIMGAFFASVNSRAALSRSVSTTINGLDSFMSWYNEGNGSSYWQCLAPPEWYEVYYACTGVRPSANNVYFPVYQGGSVTFRDGSGIEGTETFTNALWKTVRVASVNTETLGWQVDRTRYAGGFCYAKWSGGAGAGASSISVAGKDQDGNNETWTLSGTWGSGDFTATQTGVALTPTNNPYSLITEVTGVTISGATDMTIYIEARVPSGRLYPAV